MINSYGKNFEEKVQNILRKYFGYKFKKIKPYGKIGDRKNDGYIPEEGRYFQIFGPEEGTYSSEKQAIDKLKKDFYKLKEHCKSGKWEPMREFTFIYNDKDRGVSPKLEKLRREIEKKEKIICNIFGIFELMECYENKEEFKNNDIRIVKDLKNKFYDSGLLTKLENFYFGKVFYIDYFDLPNGDASGDYIEFMINPNPYYIFLGNKYEKLRKEFCKNYLECMEILGMNYFIIGYINGKDIVGTTNRNKERVAQIFENKKLKAIQSLKKLLQLTYKKYQYI